jgi:conjugal transfer pilus assembly protein TraB
MAGSRKNQQLVMLGLGSAAVIGLGVVTFGVLGPKVPTATPFGNSTGEIDVSVVSDRTSAAAPEMSWVTQSRAEIENMQSLIKDMRTTYEEQQTNHETELAGLKETYDEFLVQQAVKISELETQITGAPAAVAGPVVVGDGTAPLGGDAYTPDYSSTGSEFIERRTTAREVSFPPGPSGEGRQIETVSTGNESTTSGGSRSFGQSFSLTATETPVSSDGATVNSLRNYIPAGSYVPAVVLSGADAATNVVDRENPTPVLFRVTGPAVTAGRGSRGARVNIKGCTIQGSAIGDLSSERVKVRLISMTCLKRNGTVVEARVSGYMTGSGKAGVRGPVVSREGNLVSNAAVAGVLQGIATAAQGAPGASEDAAVADIAQSALAAAGAGGVQQAASTLSEYYINRAEQYQPVISLHGGTNVELVFLEGVSLR